VLSQNCEKQLSTLSCPSVRPPAWNKSAPTGRVFMKFIWEVSQHLSWKFQVLLKSDKIRGHFTWRPIHYFFISRSFVLKIRNISDKFVEKIKTHFVFSKFFFENRVLFLGAFAKLRKATISFVMSFRPSARMEQLCSHWTGFHEIYLRNFPKSIVKISSFIKIGQD